MEVPVHVTNRCINKDWFNMDMNDVWLTMEDYLFFISHAYNIKIHSFILMSNHFHLLVSSPDNNLSKAMQYFLSQTSRVITKSTNRINHTWARRFKRCHLNSYHYFLNTYKYIYYNSKAAGLCENVENYPFSTLYGLLGKGRLNIPIVEDSLLFDNNLTETLSWLNRPVKGWQIESMQKALRRSDFRLPSYKGHLNPLEFDTL